MSKIEKAYAITDAKISFVSLVDKAANKKQFLITKAEQGSASFASYGRIVNADAESHYITGIVYEPLTEDAHGNYMTEQEITKAAYWFAKNGNQVDVQHSFEPLPDAAVVESYVAPCDMTVGEQAIKKGTWMMTVEVNDPDIFEAVQKGEITGFSMGGVGKYSDTDDALPADGVAKSDSSPAKGGEQRGILKKLLSALGFDVVEKGELADQFADRTKYDNFWTAFYTLEDVLYRYNWAEDRYELVSDDATIREALADFNNIVTGLLTTGQPIAKALNEGSVLKAGKAMSTANRNTLQSIYTNLGEFLSKFPEEEQEEEEVTKKEIEETVASAVAKALNAQKQEPEKDPVQKSAPAEPATALTADDVSKMVDEAVKKALGQQEPAKPEPLTAENIEATIAKAVEKAMEPVRKASGLPTNLNDDGDDGDDIQKSEPHYLAGIL